MAEESQSIKLVWHCEKRKVYNLVPYDHNPRTLSETQAVQLKASLEEFNLVEIPAIDLDGTIIAGHQRMKIMLMLGRGDEEVDVRVPNRKLSESEFKRYLLRSNKNTGDWDWDSLANNFEEEMLLDVGFTPDELGKDEGATDTTGDDEVPEAGLGTPLTVAGDIYEVKANGVVVRLACGDCCNLDLVGKLMAGNLAHICVTDPPYNVSYGKNLEEDNEQGYKVREIANDSMTPEAFNQFMRDAFTSAASVLHPGALVYAFMSCKEWGTMMQVLEECGFLWKSTIIWNKSHAVLSRGDYHRKFEPCFFGKKDGAGSLCPLEDRKQNDVWDVDRPSASDAHPTTKPVELYTRAIVNSSHKGDNVIDFFSGSGTGAIACLKTGRNFFGCELSPTFVDRIIARIHTFSKQNGTDYTITRNGQPFSIAEIGDVPVEKKN